MPANRDTRVRFLEIISLIMVLIGGSLWFYFDIGRYYVSGGVEAEALSQIAIRNSDPSICAKMKAISSLPGLGVVDLFGPPITELRSSCYNEYIQAHPEKNICPPSQTQCLINYAIGNNQPSVCFQLATTNADVISGVNAETRLCILDVADRAANVRVCDLLTNAADEDYCRNSYYPDILLNYKLTGGRS